MPVRLPQPPVFAAERPAHVLSVEGVMYARAAGLDPDEVSRAIEQHARSSPSAERATIAVLGDTPGITRPLAAPPTIDFVRVRLRRKAKAKAKARAFFAWEPGDSLGRHVHDVFSCVREHINDTVTDALEALVARELLPEHWTDPDLGPGWWCRWCIGGHIVTAFLAGGSCPRCLNRGFQGRPEVLRDLAVVALVGKEKLLTIERLAAQSVSSATATPPRVVWASGISLGSNLPLTSEPWRSIAALGVEPIEARPGRVVLRVSG